MLVLVAAAIFPIVGMMSFAIDVSHWFDYSRNLQNRADAAALAAGGQFGGLCFTGGNPGSTTGGAQSAMGKWAQLYTGASSGESFVYSGTGGGTATGRVPYKDAAVSALPTATGSDGPGTGWDVTTNGYVNNTTGSTPPVTSPLTLRAGLANISNFWVALNAGDFSPNSSGANTSFTMGATSPTPPTFCSSDPTYDQTDSQCRNQPHNQTTGPCAVGPMIDVKLTQKNVPLFIPLFSGLTPTIHAHSRVTLEGEASTTSAPIAVGDTAFTPCVSVNLVNSATNQVLQNVLLPNRTQTLQTDPVQWSSNATSFTMPDAPVYVQPVLSDCNSTGQIYDDNTGVTDTGTGNPLPNTGILAINNHPASSPTVNSGDPPQIDTGGVTVGGSCLNATQYFAQSGAGCTVEVDASIKFASDVTPASKAKVNLIEHQWDNTANKFVTTTDTMNAPGKAGCPSTLYCANITIADTSGIDQLSLTWEEDAGNIGATDCSKAPNCKDQFVNGAILQQVFGACDGCDQPDDSGPIIFARVSQSGLNDINTMSPGTQSNVVFTVKLAGLNTAQWLAPTQQVPFNPPPTILRFSVSANHTTGLVDCGQGNGAGPQGDAATVYYGCGPQNPIVTPQLPTLEVNTRNSCNPVPSASPWDCIKTTSGQRRNVIVCALVERITGQPFNSNCNGNGGTCPANNWNTYQGHPPGNDPRAVTMVLTGDANLAAVSGPQSWLPIYQFATFYVVGWDAGVNPSCTGAGPGQNAPYPTKGKKNQQNGSIWGYWINYTNFGTSNGQVCPINSTLPVNCVPALTR